MSKKFIFFVLVIPFLLFGCSSPDSFVNLRLKVSSVGLNGRGHSDSVNVRLSEREVSALSLSSDTVVLFGVSSPGDLYSLLGSSLDGGGDPAYPGDSDILECLDHSAIHSGMSKIENKLKPIGLPGAFVVWNKHHSFVDHDDLIDQMPVIPFGAEIVVIIINPKTSDKIVYYDIDHDGKADYAVIYNASGMPYFWGSLSDFSFTSYLNNLVRDWLYSGTRTMSASELSVGSDYDWVVSDLESYVRNLKNTVEVDPNLGDYLDSSYFGSSLRDDLMSCSMRLDCLISAGPFSELINVDCNIYCPSIKNSRSPLVVQITDYLDKLEGYVRVCPDSMGVTLFESVYHLNTKIKEILVGSYLEVDLHPADGTPSSLDFSVPSNY